MAHTRLSCSGVFSEVDKLSSFSERVFTLSSIFKVFHRDGLRTPL